MKKSKTKRLSLYPLTMEQALHVALNTPLPDKERKAKKSRKNTTETDMAQDESQLEKQFHEAMLAIYQNGARLKPPYKATEFRRMVLEHGGRETANRLLATVEPSSGFTELFLRGKENLKISVEYVVLQNPWRSLFTKEQRRIARKRLAEHECETPPEDAT